MVTYVVPYGEIEILEYVDSSGINPFSDWFAALDPAAAARVTTAITRLALGNRSNTRVN